MKTAYLKNSIDALAKVEAFNENDRQLIQSISQLILAVKEIIHEQSLATGNGSTISNGPDEVRPESDH